MSTRNIYELDSNLYGTLLAADRMDVVDSALNGTSGASKIPPDTHNRTILIGLGGTGMKTLNHIKRVVQQRLQPQWTKYIAFLAIDSDRSEFDKAAYLEEYEFVLSTLDGIKSAVEGSKENYPSAWQPFVDEKRAKELHDYGGNGAGRKRLMGKMKIHYAISENRGVDQEIMSRISSMRSSRLAEVSGNAKYQVYVIGSLSGGTCSGGFLEIPAMVRKALNLGDRVEINAMLYLPDTVMALDPANKNELMANGYASLKELNYFQGMGMRDGHSETWPNNDPANRELKLESTDDFFDMPYLIGTIGGPKNDSDKIARETIAEFFISLLGNVIPAGEEAFLMNSFLNNAKQRVNHKPNNPAFANGEVEAPKTAHEFPRRYGTIGFAQASAPQQIIRAYTVGKACVTAGLCPISNQARKDKIAAGETFLPFLGEKQYSAPAELNQQRQEILGSLVAFMSRFQAASFSYANVIPGGAPSWDAIREGTADDSSVKRTVDAFVNRATDTAASKAMEAGVQEEFRKFRTAVKLYVEKNGPMAFYNLYHGNAAAEDGGKAAKGIRDVLQLMVDDQHVETGNPNVWPNHKNLEMQKNNLTKQIVNAKGGLIGTLVNTFNDERTKQAGQWTAAYNAAVNAQINEKRREFMLGKNGILKKNFFEPADTLTKQLYAFGKILEAMSNGYMYSGSKLDDYQAFTKVSDNSTEVNIAALNPTAHQWLQDEAAENAARVEGAKVRKALVDSFFDKTSEWLCVDDNLIKTTGGTVSLVSEETPVAARKMFDQCLSQTISTKMDVTVGNLFLQLDERGVNYQTYAKQIVDELALKSQPLFNGNQNFSDGDKHCYIMYPQSLKKNNPAIAAAIETEAKQRFGKIGFYGTDYADSIMMYQMVAPFEIYYLNDLPAWEREYEEMIKKLGHGLHGMSPDVKRTVTKHGFVEYSELTSWYDYPAITYRENPQEKDEDGNICHEGQVRNAMDKVIDEAIQMGLLYCEQDDDGLYYVYRVRMDNSVDWSFDEDLLRIDPRTEMYPMGADLIKTVAKQNRVKLADITRTVSLSYSGQMSRGHADEDWAWKYARRVLYAHRPMFNQIRDTIDRVRPWHDAVVELNKGLMNKYKPAKMIRMMMAKVFFPDEDNIWVMTDEDGMETPVVNMSDSALNRLTRRDPMGAAIVEAGFSLYYIYTKLADKVSDEELDASLTYAKNILDEYRDEETLDEAFDATDKLMKEQTKALVAMGADLDNPEKKPLKAFVNKMAAVEIEDEETIMAICDFYSKLKFWKKV